MQKEASKKKIFTVATAHLDTIWNWSLQRTIGSFIKNTLEDNFKLFEKYPDYKFNFEGAYRYELMEEYYPELFEKLKKYVAEGRWYPCGSSYENGDVNVPSPEALFRNILLGNGYFDKTFGIRSKDIFLPDCFGFGWQLPAIMRHANLLGFSTQKLTWGSVFGIPFNLGKWYGSNGDFVYGAIDMNGYGHTFKEIRNFNFIRKRFEQNKLFGIDAVAVYHGTGDQGGAPQEKSVACVEKEMADNDKSDTAVYSSRIDDVYEYLKELDESYRAKLPSHKSELTLVFHGVGSYTSRAIGKRWNKRNEILGDVAERTGVAASILGEKEYPAEKLTTDWKRVIAHQFHDDITGTSLQTLYKRCWNDYMVSLNGFSQEIDSSVAAIARRMNTASEGTPVIVVNSLEKVKRGAVSVTLPAECDFCSVHNAKGEIVPSQTVKTGDNEVKVVFIATVSAFGLEKYTVLPAEKEYDDGVLIVTEKSLENEKYLVRLDDNGDISSVYDKKLNKELLSRPIRYDVFKYDGSEEYPAWEIPYKACNGKKAVPEHPSFVSSRVLEKGAARVAVEVKQKYGDSVFTGIISLENGGERIDVNCETDWRSYRRLLKVDFGFSVSCPYATFDLGLGTIKRWNNKPNCYEMSAQNWADISDESYGVSVLSECKYGWDKPADDTLRLTILHTPKYYFHMRDSQQHKMELGLNRYAYAIYSHEGKVGGDTQEEAKRFIVPMPAYLAPKHEGTLGESYTFADFEGKGVLLNCIKKAEDSDEIVVRFTEADNAEHKKVTFGLAGGIVSAREIFASEEEIGAATVEGGKLVFDLKPYEVKSFALTVNKEELTASCGTQVEIESTPVTTTNTDRSAATLPGSKESIPAELWKEELYLGGKKYSVKGALCCKGQKIALPEGAKNASLILTSLTPSHKATFLTGETAVEIDVAANDQRVGIWDLISSEETADIRTDFVAHEYTHTHTASGDNIARQFYLFRYDLPLNGATELTLPCDENILLFAVTTDEEEKCVPCQVLFDTVTKREFNYTRDFMTKYNDFLRSHFGTVKY